MMTLRELCFLAGAEGARTLREALEYMVIHAHEIMPKETMYEEVEYLRKCASVYHRDEKLVDIIKAERRNDDL